MQYLLSNFVVIHFDTNNMDQTTLIMQYRKFTMSVCKLVIQAWSSKVDQYSNITVFLATYDKPSVTFTRGQYPQG